MAQIEQILQQCTLVAKRNHLVQSAKMQEDYVNDKPIIKVQLKLISPYGHESELTALFRTLRSKIPKTYKIHLSTRMVL